MNIAIWCAIGVVALIFGVIMFMARKDEKDIDSDLKKADALRRKAERK